MGRRKPPEPRKEDLHPYPSAAEERAYLKEQEEKEWRKRKREMEELRRMDDAAAAIREEQLLTEDYNPLQRSGESIASKYTKLALKKCRGGEFSKKCTNCGAKPFSEGPHHDKSCSREDNILRLSTDLAHKYKCTHCDARPFVPGVHHTRGCPRRVKKHVKDVVEKRDYSTTCKHCGVKPFSQGPHHKDDCKRKWSYVAYSTKLAHKYKCSGCNARPFVAGPHHKTSCDRHFFSTVF